ncbi:response regulator [Caenispirillum bisanense]|uniref:Response regulator receiver domain-containing protein n=1 Tax=Caenispirillum bisanense TaxID=414052 RepID=A0A286GXZ6_9PROT|nr:response regulator [Caenispirillum bisanense]SOD99944.1 Response regulator receiver domain-containing protein [Caenispirillum bisanense]
MTPDPSAPRIVVVDDDFLIQAYLTEIVGGLGCRVVDAAATAAEAVAAVERHRPDVVLMDVRLGGPPDGIAAAQEIKARAPEVAVIFITGSTEPETAARMAAVEPLAVLAKPILPEQLARILCREAPAQPRRVPPM